jgi:hypothetical protein
MLKVGDLVRIKNKYLKRDVIISPFNRSRYKGRYKRFRGKNRIARIVRIVHPESFDVYGIYRNAIYELDIPSRLGFSRSEIINGDYLVLHRRHERVA